MANDNDEPFSINDLPRDIIFDILSYLPLKTLARLRCVCKSWLSLVHDPYFKPIFAAAQVKNNNACYITKNRRLPFARWTKHLDSNFSGFIAAPPGLTIPTQPTRVFRFHGSCDGLITFYFALDTLSRDTICLYIWNPSTNRVKTAVNPRRELLEYFMPHSALTGFGSFKDGGIAGVVDYKAVKYIYGHIIDVYTLNTNSWKRINLKYDGHLLCSDISTLGIFSNETLHWSVIKYSKNREFAYVITFNLKTEVLGRLAVPAAEVKAYYWALGNLGESVLSAVSMSSCGIGISFWVMKEYRVEDSWTKLYTFRDTSMEPAVRRIHQVSNMSVLTVDSSGRYTLIDFDRKRCISVPHGSSESLMASHVEVAYTESLSSLDEKWWGTDEEEDKVQRRTDEEDNKPQRQHSRDKLCRIRKFVSRFLCYK